VRNFRQNVKIFIQNKSNKKKRKGLQRKNTKRKKITSLPAGSAKNFSHCTPLSHLPILSPLFFDPQDSCYIGP